MINYSKFTLLQWYLLERYMDDRRVYTQRRFGKYGLPEQLENFKVCETLIRLLHHIEIGDTIIEGINK